MIWKPFAYQRKAIYIAVLIVDDEQIAEDVTQDTLRTVEFHLSNVYAKLSVNSRTQAALRLTETILRESTVAEMDGWSPYNMG